MESRERLRDLMKTELAILEARQQRLEDHLHNRSREVPQDWADRATLNAGEEVVESLDDRTRLRIAELRHALAHFDDPDWGRCEACEEAIPLKRLEILPTARRCVDCAETA